MLTTTKLKLIIRSILRSRSVNPILIPVINTKGKKYYFEAKGGYPPFIF
jgi:hypothetical protein